MPFALVLFISSCSDAFLFFSDIQKPPIIVSSHNCGPFLSCPFLLRCSAVRDFLICFFARAYAALENLLIVTREYFGDIEPRAFEVAHLAKHPVMGS